MLFTHLLGIKGKVCRSSMRKKNKRTLMLFKRKTAFKCRLPTLLPLIYIKAHICICCLFPLHSDSIPAFPTKPLPCFLNIPWLQVAYSTFHIPLKPWESLTSFTNWNFKYQICEDLDIIYRLWIKCF